MWFLWTLARPPTLWEKSNDHYVAPWKHLLTILEASLCMSSLTARMLLLLVSVMECLLSQLCEYLFHLLIIQFTVPCCSNEHRRIMHWFWVVCLFSIICKSVPPYNAPHSLIKAWNIFYRTGVQLYLHCRNSLLSMFMLGSETSLFFNTWHLTRTEPFTNSCCLKTPHTHWGGIGYQHVRQSALLLTFLRHFIPGDWWCHSCSKSYRALLCILAPLTMLPHILCRLTWCDCRRQHFYHVLIFLLK